MPKKSYTRKKAARLTKHLMAKAGKLNDASGNWVPASSACFKTTESISGALHKPSL